MSDSPKTNTAVATKPKTSMLERLLTLAKTPDERDRAYAMAERYEQNQIVQAIAAELTAKSWGNAVSPALRVEIVRWALQQGADPSSEVDILGGKPYLNATYWARMVSAEPDFVAAEEEWVHDDPRASDEERARRKELRVRWAIPDAIAATVGKFGDARRAAEGKPDIPVKAAVVVKLIFRERGPFFGKKWSPSRASDDVGMDHPESSALTRAWRKAALLGVRRKTPFTERMKALMVVQEAADTTEPKLGAEVPGVGFVAAGTQAKPVEGSGMYDDAKMELLDGVKKPESSSESLPAAAPVKHTPSAVCAKDGEHPAAECGYNKKG